MALTWPFVGGLGTNRALKNLEEDRTKLALAIARADIAIARVRGEFCREFLRDAELFLESGTINPREVCKLVDRCYRGYNTNLLRTALTALTQTSSPSLADQVINRIDQLHRIHGPSASDVALPQLLHPAGG